MENFPTKQLFLTVLSAFGAGLAIMAVIAFGASEVLVLLIVFTILLTVFWFARVYFVAEANQPRYYNYPSDY